MSLYSRLDRLAADVEKLNRQITSVANHPQSQRTSVEGGSIDFNDEDGNLMAIVGSQDDGGNTINVISGPTPPTPVGFTVDVDHGKFIVHWSGDFDREALAPSDWSRAEVHASQDPFFVPDRTTARGSIVSAAGGEVTIGVLKGPWTIKMLAWSQAGKMSAPSAPVDVEVPGYGEIVLEEIDAAQTRIENARAILVDGQETLGTKLDEADTALASLRDSLDNLDETTLPALRQDLDAAKGRLSDAEGQITDAFGQLDAVPGQISDARQEAIDAALSEINAVESSLITSIDKKLTWSLDNPPAVFTGPVDATWVKVTSFGSGGRKIGEWRWNGDVWVKHVTDGETLVNVNAATINSGYLDVANRIRAGAIAAYQIAVGDFTNLATIDPVRDINVSRPSGWSTETVGDYTRTKESSSDLLMFKDRTDTVPFTPGGAIRVSFIAKADDYIRAQFRIWAYPQASDGGSSGQRQITSSYIEFQAGPEKRVETIVNIPSDFGDGVVYRSWIIGLAPASSSTAMRNLGVRDVSIYRMTGRTLIQPGAISTVELAADVLEVGNLKAGAAEIAEQVSIKIAAAVGQFLELDVGQLTVTGTSKLASVVAEQIAADVGEYVKLSVGQLVAGEGVMDEAVIQKLFTDVVVAGIAQAQEFIGENAILTGAVTAPKITASEELTAKVAQFLTVRAEMVDADVFRNRLFEGVDIIGSRFTVKDENGDVRAQLSAAGNVVKGEFEADTLVVNEGAEFKANNTLAQGAKITLAAGVTDPTAPPVVQPYWDGVEFTPPNLANGQLVGLAFDGTDYWTVAGSWYEATPPNNQVFRVNGSTGAVTGFQFPVSGTSERFGVTCIGSELFWLYRSGYDHKVLVTDLNCAKKREFEYPYADAGHSSTNPLVYKPGIGNDGANVVIAQCTDAGDLIFRTYNKTTGAKISGISTGENVASDIGGVYVGAGDFGSNHMVAARASNNSFIRYTMSGNRVDAGGWFAAEPGSTGVVFHDGKFHALDPAGKIVEYANINTGDESGDWWAVYAWAEDWDDNGITETWSRISPPKRFTWPRRAGIKFIGQPLPAGVQMILPAIAKKATIPTRTDFHSPTWSFSEGRPVAWYDELPTDWASKPSPRDNNNFPEAEKSVIESASGTYWVDGAGAGRWGPLTFFANGSWSGAVVSGQVVITSPSANSTTSVEVTFPPGRFVNIPELTLTAYTSAPRDVSVGVRDVSATSFTINMFSTASGPRRIAWIAFDQGA